MKLEVGEFYLSACGEIVKIYGKDEDMFLDSSLNKYFENGKARPKDKISVFDLIAHIQKELHWSIVSQVYNYYKNVNARNKIIRRHKNFFNKKKTTIPD